MRTLAAFAVLMLAACGEAERNAPPGAGAAANEASATEDNRIECLLRGGEQFERFCTIDREQRPEGRILVLRKPDGGFRRLLVATDGRGVVAADGAEPAIVSILHDNRIEVAIGGDRFRLPAQIRRP
jgi:hypothetical protein